MAYKIQALIESGYNFSTLYPEKQDSVRENTGLDFALDNIVKFLQRQTNNFTIDNSVAHDLDNAIFKIVSKKAEEEGGVEPPKKAEEEGGVEPPLEKSEEETRAEILEAIELLEMLGEDADESSKEALEILKSLV
jgi:hypothetical protein